MLSEFLYRCYLKESKQSPEYRLFLISKNILENAFLEKSVFFILLIIYNTYGN